MSESIQLMRQVAVRAIVTEHFKSQVGNEITRNLEQIDADLQQLEFKSKRNISEIEKRASDTLSNEAKLQIDTIRSQVESERLRLTQLKEEMEEQFQALSKLPLGSVITQFTIENPVEVRIGENIFQRLESGEILIKDGIIQQIKI